MDVMDDHKTAKKALIRKRNKHDFIIRKMLEDKERENERAIGEDEGKRESFAQHYSAPATLDEHGNQKVAEFRNRITGKKRASKERWNRFAATSDSGGRGL